MRIEKLSIPRREHHVNLIRLSFSRQAFQRTFSGTQPTRPGTRRAVRHWVCFFSALSKLYGLTAHENTSQNILGITGVHYIMKGILPTYTCNFNTLEPMCLYDLVYYYFMPYS